MLDNKSEVYEEQGADPFAVNDANTLLEVYGKKTCLNTNDEFGESSLDATFNLENSSSLVLQSSQASALSATTSLKRKRNEEPSKFDSALNKLLELNQKNYNVYENFAENIAAQLGGFPEDEAYILMAEIQTMVSKRKVQSTRNALNTSRILTPMPDHINVDNTGTPDVYYGEEYLDSEFDI